MPDDPNIQNGVYKPRVAFDASPTLWEFFNDDSFVTAVEGPLGSGKSYMCCAKIMKYAAKQKPNRQNMRRSRWLVIRNTYVELKSTTVKTWLELFPEAHCGPIKWSHPITHSIRIAPHGDTPGLDCEVMFLALDRPADVAHLKSLEATGAWINEASEINSGVVDMLTGRVRRFPAREDVEVTWGGIIMDTNAMDDRNWFHKYSTGGAPQLTVELHDGTKFDVTWSFYKQGPALLEVEPDGPAYFVCEPGFERTEVPEAQLIFAAGRYWWVNPKSENLKYLQAGYYHQQVQNKSLEWIQRYLQAKRIFYIEGKPWVPEYSDNIMGNATVRYDPNLPLVGGIDIGGGTLNPAAVVGQRGQLGDWRVLRELAVFDIGVERFAEALKTHLAEWFPGASRPVFYIDPAANRRDEVFEVVIEQHLRNRGLNVMLAPSNDPDVRRQALASPMGRMITLDGKVRPGFLVDQSCSTLRAGLAGKWYRKRMQTSAERYSERPEKTEESHCCDAASYMCLGGGEHAHLVRQPQGPGNMPAQPQGWGAPQTQDGGYELGVQFDPFGGGNS